MLKNTIIAILFCLLLITTGCIIEFSSPYSTISPTTEPLSAPVSTPNVDTVPINPDWKPPRLLPAPIGLPTFADVIQEVYPSVVSINTEVVTLDIFYQPRIQKGAGSGWVLDNHSNNSYIITNNHVIQGAKKVIIETFDEKTYEALPSNIKRDPYSDLAVIVLEKVILKPAIVGDSSALRVGDWVIALGNPLGQGLKAKEGTVSGIKVALSVDQGQILSDLIEVSAPINPGNSGGPLINLAGEVIGITSAKIADIGVEGLGYAISTKTAIPIIEQLITKGYVSRPYLGVSTVTINDYIYTVNRLPVNKGVIITYLDPNGPAAAAGLRKYDIITHFKNSPVISSEELTKMIHDSKIGESVTITYIRNRETNTVTVKLIESRPQ